MVAVGRSGKDDRKQNKNTLAPSIQPMVPTKAYGQ
jgi:hypothetical protein